MENRRTIVVYANWQDNHGPIMMGLLHSELLRGHETFSFEYNKEWLASEYAQILDPELQLYSGLQYLNDTDKPNFGLFLDSSPDRWGRLLMRRREAALARQEERQQTRLFETDYLLGVYDEHRMGALRFKLNENGPFLSDNKEMAAPPWTSIRELEEISLKLEEDDATDDPEYINWLNLLMAPGSSLGGARPKASVLDPNGQLWIAKFPSKNDQENTGAWEMVTYKLALNAGIDMAESQAAKFSSPNHTFLTKRFDRSGNKRIHFASAMTMLDYTDGYGANEGASYLELAEFISKNSAQVNEDLEELWRRIVFSICVSNTDDHLRNHGFILTDKGWSLSPAYDINPVENGAGLSLNISEDDNALDLDLAMAVHPYFRLTEKKAIEILEVVKSSVSNWRKVANEYGISRGEQELKQRAFVK